MYKLFLTNLILILGYVGNAQITEDELKNHVEILASEAFEGRGLNTEGIKRAELYILKQLNSMQLHPGNGKSFRQEFTYEGGRISAPLSQFMIVNGDTIRNGSDFVSLNSNSLQLKGSKLYGSYNIANTKLKDKYEGNAVLVNELNEKIISQLLKRGFTQFLVACKSNEEFEKFKLANQSGIIDNENELNFLISSKEYQVYYLHPDVMKSIGVKFNEKDGRRSKLKNLGMVELPDYNAKAIVNPSNIVGLIPGETMDSTIVISSHYDHLGIINNEVYPGANDNASGTSAVISIAGALKNYAENNGSPKYNIVFAFFSAEERGLLGSRYFTNHAPYPIGTTLANINIDMIGNKDEKHDTIPNFIYVYGPRHNSEVLMLKADSINKVHEYLMLDFFEGNHQVGNKFLRLSDQVNFMRKDVPVLFFFNGLSPYYHRTTDTPEKLDYAKMKNISNLVVDLVKDMAF